MWIVSKWLPAPSTRRKLLLGALGLFLFSYLTAPWLVALEIKMIQLYRNKGGVVRAKMTNCQYEPSCSLYGLNALQVHGFWRGNLYVTRRILVCSPIGWFHRKLNDIPHEPKGAAWGDVLPAQPPQQTDHNHHQPEAGP